MYMRTIILNYLSIDRFSTWLPLLAPPVPGQPSRNGRDAPPPPPPPYRTHGTTSDVPSRGKPPPPPSRTPAGPPPPPPPIRNGHTSISRSFVGESFKLTLNPHLQSHPPSHDHFNILCDCSSREDDVLSKFNLAVHWSHRASDGSIMCSETHTMAHFYFWALVLCHRYYIKTSTLCVIPVKKLKIFRFSY